MKIIRFINSRLATDWNLASKTLFCDPGGSAAPLPQFPLFGAHGNPRRLSTFLELCHAILSVQHLHNDQGQAQAQAHRHLIHTKTGDYLLQISLTIFGMYLRNLPLLRDSCGNQASWCQIILKCLDRLFSLFLANNLICCHAFYCWA